MASDGRNHWDDGPRIELRGDPAYRYREDEESPGAFAEPEEEEPRRRGGLGPLRFALVGLLLIGFGGLVLYAYSWGTSDPAPQELPLVAAPEGPEKERPESPGGLEVPYQDTLVLNQGRDVEEGVERLLPPPEAPQPPEPEARPTEQAAAPAATEPAADEPATGGPVVEAAPVEEIEVSEVPTPGTAQPTASEPAASVPEPAARPEPEPQVESQAETTPAPTQEQQAARPAATDGAFVVQLASVSNREAAEREWGRMQARHQQLGNLSLNVERADLGDRGIFYRIQAGPLASREAADSLCTQLRAQQQDCLVRAR